MLLAGGVFVVGVVPVVPVGELLPGTHGFAVVAEVPGVVEVEPLAVVEGEDWVPIPELEVVVVPLPAVELEVLPTPVVVPEVLQGPATVPAVPALPAVPGVLPIVPGVAGPVVGVVVVLWEGVVVVD